MSSLSVKPRYLKPAGYYLCTPEPGRLGYVISMQKGVNTTTAEKRLMRKQRTPLYIPHYRPLSFLQVMFEHKMLEIHSFPHFPLTCFDILSWKFANDFVFINITSSWSVTFRLIFLWAMPCLSLHCKYALLSYMLLHILLIFCVWFFLCVFELGQVSSNTTF